MGIMMAAASTRWAIYTVAIFALGSALAVEEEQFAGLGFSYFVLDSGEGLFNQHIRHGSMMACAIAANASFIRMPNFRTRDANMGGGWTGRPISTVYDVEHIKSHMKVVFNISELEHLYPGKTVCSGELNFLDGCVTRPSDWDELKEYHISLHNTIEGIWDGCKAAAQGKRSNAVIVISHSSPGWIWKWSNMPRWLQAQTHDMLRFAPKMRTMATKIIDHLGGAESYNGMHLRLEGDSAFWLGEAAGLVRGINITIDKDEQLLAVCFYLTYTQPPAALPSSHAFVRCSNMLHITSEAPALPSCMGPCDSTATTSAHTLPQALHTHGSCPPLLCPPSHPPPRTSH
jgi:hypothetical protein